MSEDDRILGIGYKKKKRLGEGKNPKPSLIVYEYVCAHMI